MWILVGRGCSSRLLCHQHFRHTHPCMPGSTRAVAVSADSAHFLQPDSWPTRSDPSLCTRRASHDRSCIRTPTHHQMNSGTIRLACFGTSFETGRKCDLKAESASLRHDFGTEFGDSGSSSSGHSDFVPRTYPSCITQRPEKDRFAAHTVRALTAYAEAGRVGALKWLQLNLEVLGSASQVQPIATIEEKRGL